MNTSSKYRQVLKTENPETVDDGNNNVKKPKRSIFQRAYRYVREKLPKKKGSIKISNYHSLPELPTADETPQSFDVNGTQPSVEHVSVENDLIDFDDAQPPALHIPFPGSSRRRAYQTKSFNALNLVSGVASVPTSLTNISEILSRDSSDTDVETDAEDLLQSTTSLGVYGTMKPFPHALTLVSKAKSVPELSTRMLINCDVHHVKTLNPQANASTDSMAVCDSAYVSALDLDDEANDANSLSSSGDSSETCSSSSSEEQNQKSDEEEQNQKSDEETQVKRLIRVFEYKKNSLSSTTPLVPPKKPTKMANKRKKENGHINKKVESSLKAIGNLTNDLGVITEIVARLLINNIEEFGPQFSPAVKITSLNKAVKHVFKREGIERPDVMPECIKIRDALNPNDNDPECVTGIQKDILLWYFDNIKTYKHKSSADLHLEQCPWLDPDGRVSLQNVRRSIRSVHKDLQPTLAFLAQTIDWNDVESFSSPRPKENKRGRACGHGWYFLIHHCLASHCKKVKASEDEQKMLMSFPPSGEIELDAGGRIRIGMEAITIEIGEIKTSTKGVQKGHTQLKRSLLISAFICRSIHEEINVPYILKGYIFVAGKKKKENQGIFHEERVYTPPGTLHCQVINPSNYKPAPPTEPQPDSFC
ncbi:uncharacterized protein LOC116927056 isoform X4 [Daphnia magna]|uniref:uncharacterized protein LOC116927056 isoform X4 n=1 Tax=Daphnia magna TaxID=35525 RepID=UPI001E1BCD91|nr:uncharacterized protein LOC116927056 isoform X4 [Daphnia magna]